MVDEFSGKCLKQSIRIFQAFGRVGAVVIRPRLPEYRRITLQNQPAHVAAVSVTTKNLRNQEGPTLNLLAPRNTGSELLPGVWKLAGWLLCAARSSVPGVGMRAFNSEVLPSNLDYPGRSCGSSSL